MIISDTDRINYLQGLCNKDKCGRADIYTVDGDLRKSIDMEIVEKWHEPIKESNRLMEDQYER